MDERCPGSHRERGCANSEHIGGNGEITVVSSACNSIPEYATDARKSAAMCKQ
jgi:hypothetical protein